MRPASDSAGGFDAASFFRDSRSPAEVRVGRIDVAAPVVAFWISILTELLDLTQVKNFKANLVLHYCFSGFGWRYMSLGLALHRIPLPASSTGLIFGSWKGSEIEMLGRKERRMTYLEDTPRYLLRALIIFILYSILCLSALEKFQIRGSWFAASAVPGSRPM